MLYTGYVYTDVYTLKTILSKIKYIKKKQKSKTNLKHSRKNKKEKINKMLTKFLEK